MATSPDRGYRPPTEAARVSRLLFEARERIDMHVDMVERQTGRTDEWGRHLRDEIDQYRDERGWSRHGFGGEL